MPVHERSEPITADLSVFQTLKKGHRDGALFQTPELLEAWLKTTGAAETGR